MRIYAKDKYGKRSGWHVNEVGRGCTWNPITGCNDISEGCRFCYARGVAEGCHLKQTALNAKRIAEGKPGLRHLGYQKPGVAGKFTPFPGATLPGFGVELRWDKLKTLPPHGGKDRRVFVCACSDLFHNSVPVDFVKGVFAALAKRPGTTYHVFSKRASRMPAVVSQALGGDSPRENLILGVTIESNKYVDRAEFLRQTPAAVRCLSLSPLLDSLPDLDLTDIDWVSLGSECVRGKRNQGRPVQADWVRSVRDRCVSRGIPFMFTSWGQPSSNPDPKNDPSFPNDPHGGCFLDGVEWDQSPQ